MRLLDRLLRRTPPAVTGSIGVLADDLVDVVGESYRQDALRRVASVATDGLPFLHRLSGRPRRIAEEEDRLWFRALLVREEDNEHDPNAVAVHADGVGHVGYLGRDDAVRYGPVFAALAARGFREARCPAFLIGGELGKSYGVLLCLGKPEDVIRRLDDDASPGTGLPRVPLK